MTNQSKPQAVNVFADTTTGYATCMVMETIKTIYEQTADPEAKARFSVIISGYSEIMMKLMATGTHECRRMGQIPGVPADLVISAYDHIVGLGWVLAINNRLPNHVLESALMSAELSPMTTKWLENWGIKVGEENTLWPVVNAYLTTGGPDSLPLCVAIMQEFCLHLPEIIGTPNV